MTADAANPRPLTPEDRWLRYIRRRAALSGLSTWEVAAAFYRVRRLVAEISRSDRAGRQAAARVARAALGRRARG